MTIDAGLRSARRLAADELPVAWQVVAEEAPVAGVLVEAFREELRTTGRVQSAFLTCSEPSRSLLYVGAGVLPLRLEPEDTAPLAEALGHGDFLRSSVHGYRRLVEPLWAALESHWGPARQYRRNQELLCAADIGGLDPAIGARPAGCGRLRSPGISELGRVLPASAAMYREELGIDPLAARFAQGYRRRVAGYLIGGKTWAVDYAGQLAFKADVVAREFGTAIVQGVWTHPQLRGRGIATYGMVETIRALHKQGYSTALVVNADNAAACAVYRKCGMQHVADYSTVLF